MTKHLQKSILRSVQMTLGLSLHLCHQHLLAQLVRNQQDQYSPSLSGQAPQPVCARWLSPESWTTDNNLTRVTSQASHLPSCTPPRPPAPRPPIPRFARLSPSPATPPSNACSSSLSAGWVVCPSKEFPMAAPVPIGFPSWAISPAHHDMHQFESRTR